MSVYTNKYFAYVNSYERLSGSNENFTFNVAVPQDRKFNRVVVLDAIIPKSYYLVTTEHRTFVLREPGKADVQVVIPVGCYVLSAWVSTIQGLLNSSSLSSWTYSIVSPLTSSLSSANAGKLVYNVSGNSGQPSLIMDSELFEAFGFDESSTNTFISNTLTSANVVKLQSEDRILLTSNICVGTGETDIGILQAINSQGSPDYSTIVYQNPQVDANSKVFSSSGGTSYSFALTDDDGHPLVLNGQNINFTLMLYYESPIYEKIQGFLKLMVMNQELEDQKDDIEEPFNEISEIDQSFGGIDSSSLGQPNNQGDEAEALASQQSGEIPEDLSLAQDSVPKDSEDNLVLSRNDLL